jgi:hypothetical protein
VPLSVPVQAVPEAGGVIAGYLPASGVRVNTLEPPPATCWGVPGPKEPPVPDCEGVTM